jgi:phosphoribosylformylglycinamidine (FGAM) synthase-like amidotransferase family enzyme
MYNQEISHKEQTLIQGVCNVLLMELLAELIKLCRITGNEDSRNVKSKFHCTFTPPYKYILLQYEFCCV